MSRLKAWADSPFDLFAYRNVVANLKAGIKPSIEEIEDL
jgi:hypothetical protein